ncbi:MAG: glycoside hydrolase family 47 protein [Bacteroidota bacterium]
MKYLLPCFLAVALTTLLLSLPAVSQQTTVTADMVKTEFLHAWNAYKQYAWGHDALRPLSKGYRDWYSTPLLMTPVDAFDTMELMGLKKEAEEAKRLIFERLSFHKDIEVQSFEITIRLLGGLIAAYQLDGDSRFLELAEDLAKRLLPVFNSPTGMPYRYVNLQTGRTRDSLNNPAEIGTALIEFGMVSRITRNPVYYDKAKNAVVQLFNRRSRIGLVGTLINIQTGAWVDSTSHISGMIDSYYEYLLKSWLLFDDKDCKAMWDSSITAINRYLADSTANGLWYCQANMRTGKRTGTSYGALDAFFPAVLALSGDTARAARLQESSFRMWNLYGIEPESIDYTTMKVTDAHYVLRPEIIESAYYLHHYTKDPKYSRMGEVFYQNLVKYCRTESGYAALKDVTTKEQLNQMDSFFLAETLKYLYLLFAPENTLPFDKVIFNTEAHPMRMVVKQ